MTMSVKREWALMFLGLYEVFFIFNVVDLLFFNMSGEMVGLSQLALHLQCKLVILFVNTFLPVPALNIYSLPTFITTAIFNGAIAAFVGSRVGPFLEKHRSQIAWKG
jgi:hypothetical protein